MPLTAAEREFLAAKLEGRIPVETGWGEWRAVQALQTHGLTLAQAIKLAGTPPRVRPRYAS